MKKKHFAGFLGILGLMVAGYYSQGNTENDHRHNEATHGDHAGHDSHAHGEPDEHAGHGGHGGHAEHDDHKGHDDHGGHEEDRIQIKQDARITGGIAYSKVEIREIKSYIDATGQIELNHDATAHIISRISGKIYKVVGHLGDKVKKGDTLLLINSLKMSEAKSDFLVRKNTLALAESNFQREKKLYENKTRILQVIKRDLKVKETVTALKDAELGEAKGKILTAMTNLELAVDVHKRENDLLDSGIGAKKEFVKAETNLVNARISLESVLEDVKIDAYRTFVKFQTEYLTSKSEYDEARERLYLYGLSESDIARISVVSGVERAIFPVIAPFDGTLVRKHVTLGEMAGEESLYTLSDLSKLWAMADIYEKDLASIKIGQEALLSVEAYKDRLFSGSVVHVSDLMDETTRTIKVRVVVDNGQKLLKPGMFARIMIKKKTVARTVSVPLAAVQFQEKENVVFVVLGDKKFEKRVVRLGLRDKEYVAVLDGLKEGEVVVTKGSFLLKSEMSKEELEHGHAH